MTVVILVSIHLLLVLCYTLPRTWVPDRLFYLGQRHVRPLFHQRWELFAPDPSVCDRSVQVALPDGSWRSVVGPDHHYTLRRAVRPLADLIASDLDQGRGMVRTEVAKALRGLVRDIGREVPDLRFRLVQRCVVDPAEPVHRTHTITLLRLPSP